VGSYKPNVLVSLCEFQPAIAWSAKKEAVALLRFRPDGPIMMAFYYSTWENSRTALN